MAVSSVASTLGTYSEAKTTTKDSNSSVDKDQFLKLLTVQLKNQDPMSPMQDSEFMGQMAQFSSLEQMQNMNKTYAMSHAMSMIGKSVTWLDDNQVENSGVVTNVKLNNGKATLMIDGLLDKDGQPSGIDSSKVSKITDIASMEEANSMIGKVISWYDSNKGEYRAGKVTATMSVSSFPRLVVDTMTAEEKQVGLSPRSVSLVKEDTTATDANSSEVEALNAQISELQAQIAALTNNTSENTDDTTSENTEEETTNNEETDTVEGG